MDHLQALVKYDGDYRRSNIICVTEKFHNPDIDGYTSVRLDRSKKKSSKEKGADSSCRQRLGNKHYRAGGGEHT